MLIFTCWSSRGVRFRFRAAGSQGFYGTLPRACGLVFFLLVFSSGGGGGDCCAHNLAVGFGDPGLSGSLPK